MKKNQKTNTTIQMKQNKTHIKTTTILECEHAIPENGKKYQNQIKIFRKMKMSINE